MSFDKKHRREERRVQNENQKQKRAARKQRLRAVLADHPLRLFRPTRVAALLDVDLATIWRWRQSGVLPEPVEIGGIHGWTEAQIAHLLQVGGEGGGND